MLKFLNSKKSLTLSLIVVFLFSISGTIFGTTNVAYAESNQTYGMVALGDSLAAGQNPFGVEKGYGYANAIHDYLDNEGVAGSYKNLGVSGMTSAELLDELPDSISDTVYNKKMAKSIQAVGNGIVTVDIGADDILPLFEWAINYPTDANTNTEALNNWLGNYPGSYLKTTVYSINNFWTYYPGDFNQKIAFLIQGEAQVVLGNVSSIIQRIHLLNSDAQIYLMGYYDAFVKYPGASQHPELYSAFKTVMLPSFNGYLQDIVDSDIVGIPDLPYASFVSTYPNIVTEDMLPGDIHPNKAGYEAIAECFQSEIANHLGF